MGDRKPEGANDLPLGVGYGAALAGMLGPCTLQGCPIRKRELYQYGKCTLDECPRVRERGRRAELRNALDLL